MRNILLVLLTALFLAGCGERTSQPQNSNNTEIITKLKISQKTAENDLKQLKGKLEQVCSFDDVEFVQKSCFKRDSGSKPNTSCSVSLDAPIGRVFVEPKAFLTEDLHASLGTTALTSVKELRANVSKIDRSKANAKELELINKADALKDIQGISAGAFSTRIAQRGQCAQECAFSHCNCRVGVGVTAISVPVKCIQAEYIKL